MSATLELEPQNIATIAPPRARPAWQTPHVVPPLGGSAPESAPSAPSAVEESPAIIEIICEDRQFVALCIPREITQAQLLVVEKIKPVWWRLQVGLSLQWQQWRVYAAAPWAESVTINYTKPEGQKLLFL